MKNSDYISLNKDAVEIQPNGFLNVLANLTRTGVFTYSKVAPDGTLTTVRQLRKPDEVFSEKTLDSLLGLPITNNHPDEMISLKNAADYMVGMSSDKPKRVVKAIDTGEEEFVQQLITFFEEDTIDEIVGGKKNELSLGYTVELEDSPGIWKGIKYDVIQRNIRYNHLSLVNKARGGRECKVILDGEPEPKIVQLDGITMDEDEDNNVNKPNDEREDMKVFKHGGKEYKVDEDTYSLLQTLASNTDGAELSNALKQVDKLTAANDELKEKLKEQADAEDKEAFKAAVKSRVALEGQAREVLGKEISLDDLSDSEIKVKVIKKLRPKTELKDKSDDYIDARFEICVEDAEEEATTNEDEEKVGKKKAGENADSEDPEDVLVAARKKAWEAAKNQYKAKA